MPGRDGQKILYTYIRKNACTAFKRYMLAHINNDKSYKIRLRTFVHALLRKKVSDLHISRLDPYRVPVRRLGYKSFPHSVFVYRNPAERVVSIFLNKFVHQNGATGIFSDYFKTTHKDPAQASFYDFIDYLKADFEDLNSHLWPQKSHLLDIEYTNAIHIDDLFSDMATILGTGPAEEFFQKKTNSSNLGHALADGNLAHASASDLRQRWQHDDMNLMPFNFLNDEILDFISKKFRTDYVMIKKIHAQASRSASQSASEAYEAEAEPIVPAGVRASFGR